MQNTRSQHFMCDKLENLYPYYPEDPRNVAAFAHEINRDEVFLAYGDRGIPKLVRLLEYEDLEEKKKVEALQILFDATRSQERKCEAIQLGAIQACTALLRNPSLEIKRKAAKVLTSYLRVHAARAVVQGTQTMAGLVSLLQDNDVIIRENTSAAVLGFVADIAGAEAFCETPHFIHTLVKALTIPTNSKTVHLNILEAIESITGIEIGVDICLDTACEKHLMEISPLEYAHKSFAQIMWNLSFYAQGRTKVIQAGAIPVLGALLDTDHSALRRVATGALLAASIEKQGKVEIGAIGVVESLSRCLHDRSFTVRTNTIDTIRSACDHPHVLNEYVRHLLPDTLQSVEVFGARCADVLFKVIREVESAETVGHALTTLLDIAGLSREANEQVFGCLYSIESLVPLLQHGDNHVKRTALELLSAICVPNGKSAERRFKAAIFKHACLWETGEEESIFVKIRDYIEGCDTSESKTTATVADCLTLV